jgi:site-specific recombinase XerD
VVLERFLALLAVPAWEAGPEDVDAVVAQLVANGLAASTRRGYVQVFKDFHRFLVARKGPEIDATFGVTLADPVDEFNASRHVGNDSPSAKAPPSPERMEEFFAFLRDRVAAARKFAPSGRDYALFRTLYHAGLRADEAASLELADLISAVARSARSMSVSAKAPMAQAHGRAGSRCSTSSTWSCSGSLTTSARRCRVLRHFSVTRAAARYTGARCATVCVTCSS